MMAITNTADAQTAISYTYDSTGNRIGRAISVSHIKERETTDAEDIEKDLTSKIKVTADSGTSSVKVEIIDYREIDHCIISVFASSGMSIAELDAIGEITDIDLRHQPDGVYILKIVLNGRTDTWKILCR